MKKKVFILISDMDNILLYINKTVITQYKCIMRNNKSR